MSGFLPWAVSFYSTLIGCCGPGYLLKLCGAGLQERVVQPLRFAKWRNTVDLQSWTSPMAKRRRTEGLGKASFLREKMSQKTWSYSMLVFSDHGVERGL